MRYVIFGKNGQLGREFADFLKDADRARAN